MLNRLRDIWDGIRQWSGDDAFERYLRHRSAHHPGEPVLDRKAFFKQEVERRWGGQPGRCC